MSHRYLPVQGEDVTMKPRLFIPLTFLAILITACMSATVTSTPHPIVTDEPIIPVTGMAVVQSVEIEILESQPLLVNAIIRGQLPDAGCTTISGVTQARDGNAFNITLTTTTNPLAKCAQALVPFEEVVSLDVSGLPPAPYGVNANGVQQAFKLLPRDMTSFKQSLVQALNAQDYDTLRLMMNTSLAIAFWRSEGSAYDVEPAIEQIKTNHLNANSSITADADKDLTTLPGGTDPFSVLGLDVGPNHMLFVSGWGSDGKDEAVLYMNYLLDGTLYWHGVLVAKGGFAQMSNDPHVNPPLPASNPLVEGQGPQHPSEPEKIPTITILSVTQNDQVTIRTQDFPPDTKFFVQMGKIGTTGLDGILVETFNSKKGGSITVTFDIPKELHGEKQIAIRLESKTGYYSYNWFDNITTGYPTGALPTDIEYILIRNDIEMYAGPGVKYGVIGSIREEQIVKVTGISVDGKWWQISCPNGKDSNCWVTTKPKFTRPLDESQ